MNKRTKELLASPIKEMQALGKILKEEEGIQTNLNLDTVRHLQSAFPQVIISGSVGLYLHGIRLERFKNQTSDLDIIVPYYINFEGVKDIRIDYSSPSGPDSDFDYTIICNDVKVDVKIDSHRRWDYIFINEFSYKVSCVESIIAAKIKYIDQGKDKHKDDIYEILGKKVVIPKKEYTAYEGS